MKMLLTEDEKLMLNLMRKVRVDDDYQMTITTKPSSLRKGEMAYLVNVYFKEEHYEEQGVTPGVACEKIMKQIVANND